MALALLMCEKRAPFRFRLLLISVVKDNEMRSLLKTKTVAPCLIEQLFTGKAVPATQHLEEQQFKEFSRIIVERQCHLQSYSGIAPQSPIERIEERLNYYLKWLNTCNLNGL